MNEADPEQPEQELTAEGQKEGQDAYRVDLPVFEGPLDLLLHLIRKHEVDIFDIPIVKILDEYTTYLEWMQTLNLDVAGEFLVMAATLAHIKSRMLLPPGEGVDEDLGEDEQDPREELVRRLLEYQRYKEVAQELRDRPILDRDVFARKGSAPDPGLEEGENLFAQVSVFKLIEALDRVMAKAKKKVSHEVIADRISVADRIQEITDLIKLNKEIIFEDIFGPEPTKSSIVITFISLLEMARLGMVRLHQVPGSEVLYVRNRLDDVDPEQALKEVEEES